MLPDWCSEEVEVLRAPTVSKRGSKERDWAAAEAHKVAGCYVSSGSTATERGEPRAQAVSVDAVLYAPVGSDVLAGDRVECSRGLFLVDGAPQALAAGESGLAHLRASLKRWEG